ncbi:MAG: N-acetylmuramoyl-L-alanine amidase [Deltaproteobacteria bacterium]|nr:N-acetylmuramoyl-L-alanine amidase [Deltaproteobacteria bacterium]
MNAIKIKTIIFMVVSALVLVAGYESDCRAGTAGHPKTLIKEADRCRKKLDGSSARKKYRDNWVRCINRYTKVYKAYPKSDQAPWALYHSARLHTGLHRYSGSLKDLNEAVRLNRLLVEKYPKHRLADDAQYAIGEIYENKFRNISKAYVEYLKVEVKFPDGDMRVKAKKRLDVLEVALSKQHDVRKTPPSKRSGPASVSLKDIRHWSTPNYTRVVIDLDNPAKYKHRLLKADSRLKKPSRLYVDIEKTLVPSEIDKHIPIRDGLLQRARAGQYQPDTARVVLDMVSVGQYKVFHLYDPFRIVVDVRRLKGESPSKEPKSKTGRANVRKGVRKADTPDETLSLARQLGLNVRTIVIDPGHGGKDPGCLVGSVREKDIVLDLAKILAVKIRKQIGCKVHLTRNTDKFLTLEQRTAIANMKKADLFVSLHINAHRDKRIWGLETYFLNMATDERAVMVAARENATSQKSISDLQTILNDLMLNTKLHESSRLAHQVQRGMVVQVKKRYKTSRSLGVKQAPFYVLIGANMPSILIETGFITNAKDKKRLRSKKYREGIADGICSGIKSYIRETEKIYQ